MRVSILTPYYTPDPLSDAAREELAGFLAALATQPGPCEIVLAAACPGRRDRLSDVAAAAAGPGYPHPLRVIHLGFAPGRQRPASRGAAINAAAAAATGELFQILHLDLRLPAGALDTLRAARRRGFVCGAFPKRYTPCPPLLAAQEWWLNRWHLGVRHRTVGTNAVWLDRALWEPLPTGRLLEDIVLSERLRRHGLHVAAAPVEVGAGKYLRTGVAASMAINAAVLGLHRVCHASPDCLADELYSRHGLAVGTSAFWPRLACAVGRVVQAQIRG